jgi:cytochrome c oxidase subunit 2
MTRSYSRIAILAQLTWLSGCGWQSALETHGAPADTIKHLMLLIIAVCALVWLLVIAILGWALWRGRPPADNPLDLDQRTERRMMVSVIAGVAVTVVVITGFTVASFLTTRSLAVASDTDLTIRVRGLQWWWDVEYADADAQRSFKSANEIHIPVGRNIRIALEGVDVIHSFWVPSLAGKQDLIPGRNNELTIRADRPGIYRGQCAEFCGLQHAHMAFLVVAEDAAAFDAWANTQRGPAVAVPSDATEIQAGQQVFLSKPCAACHTIRGTSAAGTTGPDLTHIGSRGSIAAGLLETTRGSLAAWIADPQTLKPGNNMPMVPLSPNELLAVSAYMASLK